MDADGNNAFQLTAGVGQDLYPKFSPDGKLVTYSSNKNDGNFEIYVIQISNRTEKRLTHDAASDSNSYFSPDGNKIVFVSNRGGRQEIWVMDKDGGNAVALTNGQNEAIEPNWAELKKE